MKNAMGHGDSWISTLANEVNYVAVWSIKFLISILI